LQAGEQSISPEGVVKAGIADVVFSQGKRLSLISVDAKPSGEMLYPPVLTS
jgi:hypothetical protein